MSIVIEAFDLATYMRILTHVLIEIDCCLFEGSLDGKYFLCHVSAHFCGSNKLEYLYVEHS